VSYPSERELLAFTPSWLLQGWTTKDAQSLLLTPAFPGKKQTEAAPPCKPIGLFSARGLSGSAHRCEVPVPPSVANL